MALVLGNLSFTCLLLDQLAQAEQAAQESLQVARAHPLESDIPLSLHPLGAAKLEQGKTLEAQALFAELITDSKETGNIWGQAAGNMYMSMTVLRLKDYPEAARHAEEGVRLYQEIGQLSGIGLCYSLLGQSAAASQDYLTAMNWYRQALSTLGKTDQYPWINFALYHVSEWFVAQDQPARAVEILALIQQSGNSLPQTHRDTGALLERLQAELPAVTYNAAFERGKTLELQTVVIEILATAQHRPPAPQTTTHQPLSDLLSERELEILRLVAQGLSNREIAHELIISLGTVKTHIHNICGKLGVSSRTQAIAHARDLNLI